MKRWRNDNNRRRNYLLSYSLIYCSELRPSNCLDLFQYGRPVFPIHRLLSSSLNTHLPQILRHIFQLTQSKSSPSSASSTSLRFTLKYFLNSSSLIRSYYMSSPFQPLPTTSSTMCVYIYIYIYIYI
jgi:hypothetical protein